MCERMWERRKSRIRQPRSRWSKRSSRLHPQLEPLRTREAEPVEVALFGPRDRDEATAVDRRDAAGRRRRRAGDRALHAAGARRKLLREQVADDAPVALRHLLRVAARARGT